MGLVFNLFGLDLILTILTSNDKTISACNPNLNFNLHLKNYFLTRFPQSSQKLIASCTWTITFVVGYKDLNELLAKQPKEIENDLIDFIISLRA